MLMLSLLQVNIFIQFINCIGHETSSHALAFGLGLLALHPDVQAKMYQNVKDVLGDRLPEYSDFAELHYIQAVFEEILRMYPPGYSIPKWVAEPTEIGGYNIGPQMAMYIDVRSLHMNPKHWDQPLEFRPERFVKGNREKIHSHAFLPFSDGKIIVNKWTYCLGPRSCIGRRFAMVEAVCILTMIVQKYTIVPAKPGITEEELVEAKLALTLTPKNPVNLVFKKRV